MAEDVLEYEYGTPHLNEKQALERYRRAISNQRDALVVLEDLDCGHWTVNEYKTDAEKETFIRKRLAQYFEQAFSSILRRR